MAKKKKKKGKKENAEKPLPRGIDRRYGRYRVRIHIDGVQYSVGDYDKLSLAKLAREEAEKQKIKGTFVPGSVRRQLAKEKRAKKLAKKQAKNLTVKDWSEQWLESLADASPPRSPGTIASYRSTLNAHVLGPLGTKPLAKVTREQIQACVDAASKGRTASPGRNTLRTVRAMYNAAIEAGKGGVKKNPAIGVKSAGHSRLRTDDEVPTLDELQRIVAAMPPGQALAVELAAWCSLRIGEVIGLQRRDITGLDVPGGAALHVRRQWLSKARPPDYGPPKDGSARTIHIPANLVPRIEKQLERVGNAPNAPLFPSTVDPTRPISHNALTARWRKARDTVRPGLDFHALRHFGLTFYAQQGATPEEVMRRGGHKDASVAQRYQHASAARDQELTARLNAVVEKAAKERAEAEKAATVEGAKE